MQARNISIRTMRVRAGKTRLQAKTGRHGRLEWRQTAIALLGMLCEILSLVWKIYHQTSFIAVKRRDRFLIIIKGIVE